MRVSEYYGIRRTQPTLDFVDVDISGDVRLFVDPRALRLLKTDWATDCVALIQNFFHTVLQAIQEGEHEHARGLLSALKEPNETHLGLSRGRAQGRALGHKSAREVWEALSKSEAVRTGLLEDLEDTILMVPGISSDIVSDMATNIIREPLIRYTQDVCAYYGIPVQVDVDSGPLWDPRDREWYSEFSALPVTSAGKLLLVPKAIVRRRMDYNEDEYYRYYVLEFLREMELSANTKLVRLLKSGVHRVTKKDLIKKYGAGKEMIVDITRKHPEILDRYRDAKRRSVAPPLNHPELAEYDEKASPDWDALLGEVIHLDHGRPAATQYEEAIEKLLTALFYPSLTNPKVQKEIHGGRKRIDITYANVSTYGFFAWLSQHYTAPFVFVECKNYSSDPGNEALDQLAGRFSPRRGRFGILVCRTITDKDLFRQRCRDTADDGRGFIVPLDDDDLRLLVDERKQASGHAEFGILRELFDQLVM